MSLEEAEVQGHQPVLLEACLKYLDPRPGQIFLDATIGGGGHAEEILKRLQPGGRLIGIDRDPAALTYAFNRLKPFASSLTLVRANFMHLRQVFESLRIEKIHGCLFDLGVSSLQLLNPARGFSYSVEGPLDMRYEQGGLSAYDLVNNLPEAELARIIRVYGEEKWAERIAAFICAARARKPIETTTELVAVIKAAIPARARRSGSHPAKRTFQALRIAVNKELEALEKGLEAAEEFLAPGGRIAVISFHSLEDRIVKRFFREKAKGCICPPGVPVCTCGKKPTLKVVTPKPVVPSPAEVEFNPRARSAKLRVAEKVYGEEEGA